MLMRVIAVLGFAALALSAAPARSQDACQAMMGRVVTATGMVSDFVYLQSADKSQFFISDTNLPCNSDIWVFVDGRILCSDGKKATILGRFDTGELQDGTKSYVLLTDAEHARCK